MSLLGPMSLATLSPLSTQNLLYQTWEAVLSFLPFHCLHPGGCYFAHLTEEETKGHSDPLPQVALSLTELSLGSGWLAPGQFFPPDPVIPTDQLGRRPGKPPHSTCYPLTLLDQQWYPQCLPGLPPLSRHLLPNSAKFTDTSVPGCGWSHTSLFP